MAGDTNASMIDGAYPVLLTRHKQVTADRFLNWDFNKYETITPNNPEKAGLNSELIENAIQFAINNESTMDRDIGAALEQGHFEEPWPIGKTIGPVAGKQVRA